MKSLQFSHLPQTINTETDTDSDSSQSMNLCTCELVLFMITSSNGYLFRVTGHFWVHRWIPSQRPVTQSYEVFFDLLMNKWLSKHSRRRWFETLSRSLRRHCNVVLYLGKWVYGCVGFFEFVRMRRLLCGKNRPKADTWQTLFIVSSKHGDEYRFSLKSHRIWGLRPNKSTRITTVVAHNYDRKYISFARFA